MAVAKTASKTPELTARSVIVGLITAMILITLLTDILARLRGPHDDE